MKLFDKTWIAMLMLSAVLVIPMRTQASAPHVIISEIGWAGSEVSSSDEWIELTNTSTTQINISGYMLTGAGSGGESIVIPDGSLLEPHSTYLIANYDQTHENSTLGATPNIIDATLSLSNSGFAVHLNNHDGAQIDSAGDGTTPFAGGSGGTEESDDGRYRSMVRVDGSLNGTLETSWMNATTSTGFKEASTGLGTPGYADVWLLLEEITEEEPTEEAATDSLIITEFVSNPLENEVEWIEVLNASNQDVDLTGWTIEDATERQTPLGEETLLAGAFFLIESPTGQLNNDGDSIIIKDKAGSVVDQLEYGTDEIPAPDKGQATALTSDGFQVTDTPTPGDENLIEILEAVEEPVPDVISSDSEESHEETEAAPSPEEEAENPEPQIETEPEPEPTTSGTTTIVEDEEYTDPTTLFFVELYPNTPGSDADEEYIILKNTGIETLELKDWSISDEAGNHHTFSSGALAANTELTLMRTESDITLNNNGDILFLYSPKDDLIDTVIYDKAASGEKYVLTNGVWTWESEQVQTTETTEVIEQGNNTPTPTPAPQQVEPTKTTTTSSTTNTSYSHATYSSANATQNTTINEAKTLSDGSHVTLSGVVTAIPGTLGKQILYIQDETGGIQVYKHDSLFPELDIGDVISFTGELSTTRSERRVKLATDAQITITQTPNTEPIELDADELEETLVGQLVTTTGTVQTKASTRVTLEQDGEEAIIYLGSSGITTDLFERGAKLKVTGVLTNTSGELRIRPRSENDILILENETELITTTATTGKDAHTNNQSKTGWILVLITAGTLGILALRKYFPHGRTHAPA